MWQDVIAWLVASFLVAPLQASLNDALAAGRAPAATITLVTDCVTAATPVLAARAAAEPIWLIQTAFGAWIGTLRPETVLAGAAPSCTPALAAARPFLGGA